MTIIHYEDFPKDTFTTYSMYLGDNYLSLKAKGLLGILFRNMKNMKLKEIDFSEEDLAVFTSDQVGSVKSAFKELETLGYISRNMLRDEHGRFVGKVYTLHALLRDRPVLEVMHHFQ